MKIKFYGHPFKDSSVIMYSFMTSVSSVMLLFLHNPNSWLYFYSTIYLMEHYYEIKSVEKFNIKQQSLWLTYRVLYSTA